MAPILRNGVHYWPTYTDARDAMHRAQAEGVATTHARIVHYGLGRAVQHHRSGPYLPEAYDTSSRFFPRD